ncbi:MAG: hypothetical protein AMS18_05740 [Gemmatimonas sp. SG8_17]|nr:MAG: hypothetical protein AMS18_05740 [Gemmatimonas sp. SG8_17]
MQQYWSRTIAFGVCAVVFAFAACSDSNGPEDMQRDLTGSYTLVSISQGTAAGVLLIPGATGTFTLTATTYHASLTIPQPPGPDLLLDDHGTYTATGSETAGAWTQQSTDDPNLQYTGSYSWSAATSQLTLDSTAGAIRTVLVLQRN